MKTKSGQRGFTLVELMVVMTIMSILAAIVVPQVTGTTTAGRGAVMTSDIKTVQEAVEKYVGENSKGQSGGWPTADGTLPTSPATKPLAWGANFIDPQSKAVKSFQQDYLRTVPAHSGATRPADNKTSALTDGSVAYTIATSGTAPNITTAITYTTVPVSHWVATDVTTAGSEKYPVWRIDSTGKVYLNLNDSEY